MTQPSRRGRRRLVLLAAVLSLLAGGYVWRASYLPYVALVLDVSESPRPVDYVMVLHGSPNTRPFVAAALVDAKLAKQVLFVRCKAMPEVERGTMPSEEELVRRILLKRGVPASAIQVLPEEGASTQDEARALANFLRSRPTVTVAVVTTDYHTRRARRHLRQELGEAMERVHFVGAPTDGFGPHNWWCFEEGWSTYLHEYAKLGYHALRGS